MNFLAHLHLALLAHSSLLGNLVADFVRGNPDQYYDTNICTGIMMHRRIDVLVDQLPEIKQARSLFERRFYRISPITLDIIWDHFLSRDWNELQSDCSLMEFSLAVERQIRPQLNKTPAAFQRMNHYLWGERWLENYANLDFIDEVLYYMQKQRPKLLGLHESINEVKLHYSQLDDLFGQFYPLMMAKAKSQSL